MKSELLAALKAGVHEYTHIINVGSTTSTVTWIGYLAVSTEFFAATGSLTPNSFEGFEIQGLLQLPVASGRTTIQFTLFSYDNVSRTIYIARKDNQIFVTVNISNYMTLIPISTPLLTTDDVDKDVPIWLSTTPPPYA